LRSLALKR